MERKVREEQNPESVEKVALISKMEVPTAHKACRNPKQENPNVHVKLKIDKFLHDLQLLLHTWDLCSSVSFRSRNILPPIKMCLKISEFLTSVT
jgi:hypothetical protein